MPGLKGAQVSSRLSQFYHKGSGQICLQSRRSPHFYYSNFSNGRSYSSAPRIAQPSFWRSLVPKPWRSESTGRKSSSTASNPQQQNSHNPFLIYAIIFLFVGSNAINQIGIRNQLTEFTRKTDAQLALLREVIRKVHAGEKVDVEGLLGTGDPKREKEWEEVLKEVEGIDELWEGQKRKAAEKAEKNQRKDEEVQKVQENSKQGDLGGAPVDAPKKRFGFY